MIKTKITNISNVRLEFFVKVDNSDDVLVSVEPGGVVFSDGEEPTRSMRVFERKNLISILIDDFDSISIETEDKTIKATWIHDITEHINEVHGVDAHVEVKQMLENELNQTIVASITDDENPYKDLLALDLTFEGENFGLDEAKKQAESYVEESEDALIKEKKKYNYKKKPGRKKKRGPKPGSKRKKGE